MWRILAMGFNTVSIELWRPPYNGFRYCSVDALINDHSDTVLCFRSERFTISKRLRILNWEDYNLDMSKMFFTFLNTFTFSIVQKCAEPTRIQMIQNRNEKMFVEFKCMWILFAHLPNAIDKLQKDGRAIRIRMMIVTVSNSMLEFMAKWKPLFFN